MLNDALIRKLELNEVDRRTLRLAVAMRGLVCGLFGALLLLIAATGPHGLEGARDITRVDGALIEPMRTPEMSVAPPAA